MDGPFDFAIAYAPSEFHTAESNTHRAWILARLLQSDFPLSIRDAENGNMPVSVIPDKKLSIKVMAGIFRNHFENTDLCKYSDGKISPHSVNDFPVCNSHTHKVNIIQQRNWLPVEIGTVNWRALSHPCQSVFIPWYLGINEIPEAYQMAYADPAGTDKKLIMYHFEGPDWQIMDINSASSVFRLLNNLGDSYYSRNHMIIRESFDEMEADLFNYQSAIEKEILNLFETDKGKAMSTLTEYTNTKAMMGFEKAKSIIMDFLNQ